MWANALNEPAKRIIFPLVVIHSRPWRWTMNANPLRGMNISSVTTALMRYALPLAIVQVLCVVVFAAWGLSI